MPLVLEPSDLLLTAGDGGNDKLVWALRCSLIQRDNIDEDTLAELNCFGPFVLQCTIGAAVEAGVLSEMVEGAARPLNRAAM